MPKDWPYSGPQRTWVPKNGYEVVLAIPVAARQRSLALDQYLLHLRDRLLWRAQANDFSTSDLRESVRIYLGAEAEGFLNKRSLSDLFLQLLYLPPVHDALVMLGLGGFPVRRPVQNNPHSRKVIREVSVERWLAEVGSPDPVYAI